jgi:hypothetical protein
MLHPTTKQISTSTIIANNPNIFLKHMDAMLNALHLSVCERRREQGRILMHDV